MSPIAAPHPRPPYSIEVANHDLDPGRERGGDTMTLTAIVLGTLALLWVGVKTLRFAFRAFGAISTALTVLGALLWLRDQLAPRRHANGV
jgi:hypothetical protein